MDGYNTNKETEPMAAPINGQDGIKDSLMKSDKWGYADGELNAPVLMGLDGSIINDASTVT